MGGIAQTSRTEGPFVRDTRRRWAVASVLGTLVFLVCAGVGVVSYPGGTWFDAHAVGHSFTKNFLCDLMQTVALNGQPNPVGARVVPIGIAAMFFALAAFYTQVAQFEVPESAAGRVARRFGWATFALGMAIPFVTSDRHRLLHLTTVVAAFLPSVVASVAAFRITLRVSARSARDAKLVFAAKAAAVVTLGAGIVDGLLYGFAYASPVLGIVPPRAIRTIILALLPLLQRVALLGVIAWVLAVSARSWFEAGASPPAKE